MTSLVQAAVPTQDSASTVVETHVWGLWPQHPPQDVPFLCLGCSFDSPASLVPALFLAKFFLFSEIKHSEDEYKARRQD